MADIDPQIPHGQGIILLEDGWARIQKDGIERLREMIREKNSIQDAETQSETKYNTQAPKAHFTNEEYMKLYTTVYQMCIQKGDHCYNAQLYDRYYESITQYLKFNVLPEIKRFHGQYLLKELVRRWNDHLTMQRWLCNFFRYLNRFYVKRYNKNTLEQLGVMRFRELVFDEIVSNATNAILDLIEEDRNGHVVNRDLLRDGIKIYVEMGMGEIAIYAEKLQKPFIQATVVYYTREAENWLQSDSCSEYLIKAERRIDEEQKRLDDFLHSSTQPYLTQTLNETLLISHHSSILNKENTGARAMLAVHAVNDFARMFKLYNAIPLLDPIAKIVKEYIEHIGLDLCKKIDPKNQTQLIEDLINVHDKYYEMVLTAFANSPIFHKALKEAFENVVNKPIENNPTTAELLANYADKLLNKSGIRLPEAKLQDTLDKVVRLFTYLTDKDMFSEFYRKHLSARLLLQRSSSSDAETAMIGKLKLRCGAQFTSKMEGMINDMRRAEEYEISFKDFLRENRIQLSLEFSAQVLTSGFWPSYPSDDLKLPTTFTRCIDIFKQFYNAKTSNRRVRWLHNLGVVTLAGNFEKKRIDLVVNTNQASILVLFNENEELSIERIIQLTGLSPENVNKYLRSLVSPKCKILMKKPAEGYHISHTIRVNTKFTHQQRRVKVPSAPSKISAAERKQTEEAVGEDRRHAIEANIVRVMKARKTLSHTQLMTEVSSQLMQFFTPDPRQIKKRIEDLIAREYLERDKDQSSVYHYLA